MTITTKQAIALAREVGAVYKTPVQFYMYDDEITALCNAVRKQTLLEAAEWFSEEDVGVEYELRRMAGVE